MEAFIVTLIILLFVFLNSLPFIAGVLATPTGSVFLGTVHWPGDYFYYLSQFAQGREGWFTSYDLYTNDFPQKTLVGWVNVFLGRLFSLVGVDHPAAYQLSIVIFTALFLLVSYFLIREICFSKRLLAFFLFTASNAFPGYDFWFNNGVPFNRLSGVPHHLIARTVIVLALFLAVRWWRIINIYYFQRTYVIIYIFSFLVLGFILASVEPVHWILIVGILFLVPLIYKIKKLKIFLPSIFLFFGGLPMAIYLKRLFASPPYSQLVAWEASQQVNISFLNFLLANGPVMVLAIVGFFVILPRVLPLSASWRIASPATTLLIIFPLLTLALFFSPLPRWVNIINVRFLPAVTTLFLAVLATEAISILVRVLPRSRVTHTLILLLLIASMFPSYYVQIQKRIKTEPANAFFYITKEVFESYKEAEKISTSKDTFLVIWPFNWSFPGITGRRVYEGHTLLTTEYDKKELKTRSFFFGDTSSEEMEKMLRINNIDYVLTYPWLRNINELSNLEKIFDNGSIGIYKVK